MRDLLNLREYDVFRRCVLGVFVGAGVTAAIIRETEILARLLEGAPLASIMAGVNLSVAGDLKITGPGADVAI